MKTILFFWVKLSFFWVTLGASVNRDALPGKDERGLSQSTENAVLLAGSVLVAAIVVAVIKSYVESHLPG